MTSVERVFAVLIPASLLFMVPASGEEIAFLKNGHVFRAAADGSNVRQLDRDSRPKSLLRWDAVGKRLSYAVSGQNGEKARLVLIDLNGKQLSELKVRPSTDPPTEGLRFIEEVSWLSDGRVRVGGSIGPSNCEMFDIDPATEKESNWQIGRCGTFSPSPDGKHLARLGPVQQFAPDDQRFDTVQMDQRERFYVGASQGIFIKSGPSWAPDSQSIAIIEKQAVTGQAALTILSVSGEVMRVPISAGVLDHPSIAWVGARVIAGEGPFGVEIDTATGHVGPLTSSTGEELIRDNNARLRAANTRRSVEDIVKRGGGSEGIELQ